MPRCACSRHATLHLADSVAMMVVEGSTIDPSPDTVLAHVAAALPAPAARMQALASEELEPAGEAPSDDVSPAEDARCIGLLHACQTWLQLRDGQNNSIVITSPTDDATELINQDVVLPASGAAIPASTWGLLQDACKYGLADLSTCSKPRHWPRCSGLACGGQGAHEFRQPGPGGADAAGAKH